VALNSSLKVQANFWPAYHTLAVTYGNSGQEENARAAVKRLLDLAPDFSIEKYKKITLIKNLDEIENEIKTLRKAGLPE